MLQRQALSRAGRNIVPIVSVVRRHERYGFRRVHNTAAAERHDKVAAIFPGERRVGHYGRFQRIRFDTVENHRGHTGILQLVDRSRQVAGGFRGTSV